MSASSSCAQECDHLGEMALRSPKSQCTLPFNFPLNVTVCEINTELPQAHCSETVFLMTAFIKKTLSLCISEKALS